MSETAPNELNLQLYPKQMRMMTTQANEILFGGAKGGGKSFALRWAALLYALYVEGLEIYFFRRKYSDLKSNHIFGPEGYLSITDPFIKAGMVSFNSTDNRLDFFHPGGKTSRIFLRHVQHDKDMENYRGIEAHVIIFDELVHFPESVYKFLRTHSRLGGLIIDYEKVRQHLPFVYDGYFPRIISGTNPGGIGHNWIKREFIDAAPPNTVWTTPDHKGGMNRIYIPSLVTDNVKLMENDPGYINRIKGLGGSTAKAFLDGDWNMTDGGIVSDLWDEEIHVLPQLVIPQNATIYRGLDWGTFHPSVVLYFLKTRGETLKTVTGEEIDLPSGSIVVIHEIYNWDGDDENVGNRKPATEVGRQMAQFESQVPWRSEIRPGPADRQIFQQRGGISDTIDNLIVKGYNGYMEELSATDPSFRWMYEKNILFEAADQSTGSRVTGLSLMRDFLQAAIDFKMEGGDKRGLFFVETARHCIATIPDLPRSETNPEDVETSGVPDHAYDVVRYMCMSQAGEYHALTLRGI